MDRIENPLFRHAKRGVDLVAALVGLALLPAVTLLAWLGRGLERSPGLWEDRVVVGPDRRSSLRSAEGADRRKIWQPGRPLRLRVFRTGGRGSGPSLTGRFLIATGLDRLPLAWPLLKGDITLVGPHLLELGDFLRHRSAAPGRALGRASATPGITGLAQLAEDIHTQRDPVGLRLALDSEYLRRRTLRLDLAILMFTALDLLVGRRLQP